ncbi:MAG: type II toxin-antitoxin system VapC family toxin [Verrucomicrobiota bacterium]
MSILVDTNIIFDVTKADPIWAEWSEAKLKELESLDLAINPVIFAEFCFDCPSVTDADRIIRLFGFSYLEMPRDGLFRASQAFRKYRKNGGGKQSILPDFFIGGHAESNSLSILTRDTNRYRTYFPNVTLICP